jgi:2'-5' RNA ligase
VGGREPGGKRVFLAVDVSEPVREALAQLSSRLRSHLEPRFKASWVRPDRMHLTLHFFEDADAAIEERIRAALSKPLPRASFDLSFEGLGMFPKSGPPRVLWLGIRDGLSELSDLHDTLRLNPDFPQDRNPPFAPHLTLARFKDRVPRRQLDEITSIPAAAGPCRIDRVTLYESRLSPAGPLYTRLAEAPLRP